MGWSHDLYILLYPIIKIRLDYKHIITGEWGLRCGMEIMIDFLMETRVRKKMLTVEREYMEILNHWTYVEWLFPST